MKTYLSIDLDFWNYFVAFNCFIPDPWSKIATLLTLNIPILVVENHDELTEHANSFGIDKLVNVDYHDDLGDGTEEHSLSCANWPLHLMNTGRISYIWRHPHSEDIVPGLCNENMRFPDIAMMYGKDIRENNGEITRKTSRKIRKMWRDEGDIGFNKKTMAFGFPEFGRLGRIVAVGISISPTYTVPTANSIIDAVKLLTEDRPCLTVTETARIAIFEMINNYKVKKEIMARTKEAI
jgi:hypothetical protein